MSHSNYTASERRGVLAIAIIALLLIGGGVLVSLIHGNKGDSSEYPIVREHPELIDSAAIRDEGTKQTGGATKKSNVKKRNSETKSSKKSQKTYRRRSPLDEPV